MHTAYVLRRVVRLQQTIESVCSPSPSTLLIGTRQGHLLMYRVTEINNDNKLDIQLIKTNRHFSRRPVQQLAAVSECSLLISLSDSLVSLHDLDENLTSFPCMATLSRTKGASLFALNTIKQKSLTGEIGVTVRLVVVVKKKLLFFYYKNRDFLSLREDVSLPEVPRAIEWQRDVLVVAFKNEYAVVRIGGGQSAVSSLFPTNSDSTLTLLKDGQFALTRDTQTTFMSVDCELALHTLNWNNKPTMMSHDMPYLIAVNEEGIEIRAVQPRMLVQNLELSLESEKNGPSRNEVPKFVCSGGHGMNFVASFNEVWCLSMVSVSEQLPHLLRDKQFELAVVLANVDSSSTSESSSESSSSLERRVQRIQQIQTLCAFDLFCQHKFSEAMTLFLQLDMDASHVIGLYPSLLPSEFRNQIIYPDSIPQLQGRDLEHALLALIDFLTQIRHRLKGSKDKTIAPLPINEKCSTIKSKRQMLQILDTTLLKCYLRTNDALVASLLRLKDNHCHLEETERALKKHQRFSELVIFYNSRKLHKKALTLLKEHANRDGSPLKGLSRMVQYLQSLGAEHLDLIFEFSAPLLSSDFNGVLEIFIGSEEYDSESESLPRAKVLDFLSKNCPDEELVVDYLRHVIHTWKDTSPILVNALILRLKDRILKSNKDSYSVREEKEELRQLLTDLSSVFSADLLLAQFPTNDYLVPERCILLRQLGRHKEALNLLLYQQKDLKAAEAYCQKAESVDSDVYTELFMLLLYPPSSSSSFPLQTVLSLLSKYSSSLQSLSLLLSALPDSVPLASLKPLMASGLERKVEERKSSQVLKALTLVQHLQLQRQRLQLEARRIDLKEYDLCHVCHKRFQSQGAFVVFPSGSLVHLSCQQGNIPN